ncbi:hypothetical protein BGZ97_005990 [Linnemannia gamsii]|uniref:WRKY domain-containing protein n=1 Tax=Linnemannia gamsii TaxID=64522 RepID=A0A9P6QSB9_9FUNG|nr:hypothetical protein BGZ97_005990 [Linnemannia gamsii]
MNSSSSFGFLPYQASASQMTSPGAQAHPQHHQQQQHHHPHHQQQQTLSQQQLSHDLAQELSSPPPLPLHASSLHSSSSTAASLSGSSTSPISVSASGTLLSATINSNGSTGAGNNSATPGGNTGSNNSTAVGSPTGVGPTVASSLGSNQHGGHPTINTAMLSNYGGMLSSPPHSSQAQSSSASSTPGSILPTTPHQTADLDTILATYASQPELLKMIIASKTEEDRRWAEEARFKMMDLMLRENRGMNLMTGYEGLLAQTSQTSPTGTPGSSITTGNMGGHPSSATTTTTTTSTTTTQPSSTTVSPTSATMQTPTTSLGLSSTGKRFMDDDDFDSPSASLSGAAGPFRGGNGSLGGLGGVGLAGSGNGSSGFGGQGLDHSLARKRSVTFAREIHQGHNRSQSLSAMPSGPHSISTVTSTPLSNPSNQFGTLSMLGLTGPNTSLQQHMSSSFQQHPQSASSGSLSTLQQQYQQPSHQPHQAPHHQQPHQFSQHQHQQNQHLPPQFGQYPQMFSYHTTLPQLQQQGVIRRTNSLSHLSQFAQSSVSGGTSLLDQQRMAAGRPRNVSASSLRTQDDSDDESDDDYSDHPVMGGMHSRPGSSLSMNNMMGGNGETSLTLEFSDLASVSGPSGLGQGGYSHQQHQQHQQPHHHQSYGGHNSVVSMTMAALGPGAITSTGLRPTSGSLSSLTGGSGNGGSGGADGGGGNGVGVDQKRKRKRREMQPVNKIVDSAEPHIDQFLWKNNGNTTQKKTGCKSIYYKCSNSANGCTVNKTVTEKEGGGYVTKYRGEHLDDCIKLKRAQQAAQAAQQAAHHAYST